jgi:hypothetical protein
VVIAGLGHSFLLILVAKAIKAAPRFSAFYFWLCSHCGRLRKLSGVRHLNALAPDSFTTEASFVNRLFDVYVAPCTTVTLLPRRNGQRVSKMSVFETSTTTRS